MANIDVSENILYLILDFFKRNNYHLADELKKQYKINDDFKVDKKLEDIFQEYFHRDSLTLQPESKELLYKNNKKRKQNNADKIDPEKKIKILKNRKLYKEGDQLMTSKKRKLEILKQIANFEESSDNKTKAHSKKGNLISKIAKNEISSNDSLSSDDKIIIKPVNDLQHNFQESKKHIPPDFLKNKKKQKNSSSSDSNLENETLITKSKFIKNKKSLKSKDIKKSLNKKLANKVGLSDVIDKDEINGDKNSCNVRENTLKFTPSTSNSSDSDDNRKTSIKIQKSFESNKKPIIPSATVKTISKPSSESSSEEDPKPGLGFKVNAKISYETKPKVYNNIEIQQDSKRDKVINPVNKQCDSDSDSSDNETVKEKNKILITKSKIIPNITQKVESSSDSLSSSEDEVDSVKLKSTKFSEAVFKDNILNVAIVDNKTTCNSSNINVDNGKTKNAEEIKLEKSYSDSSSDSSTEKTKNEKSILIKSNIITQKDNCESDSSEEEPIDKNLTILSKLVPAISKKDESSSDSESDEYIPSKQQNNKPCKKESGIGMIPNSINMNNLPNKVSKTVESKSVNINQNNIVSAAKKIKPVKSDNIKINNVNIKVKKDAIQNKLMQTRKDSISSEISTPSESEIEQNTTNKQSLINENSVNIITLSNIKKKDTSTSDSSSFEDDSKKVSNISGKNIKALNNKSQDTNIINKDIHKIKQRSNLSFNSTSEEGIISGNINKNSKLINKDFALINKNSTNVMNKEKESSSSSEYSEEEMINISNKNIKNGAKIKQNSIITNVNLRKESSSSDSCSDDGLPKDVPISNVNTSFNNYIKPDMLKSNKKKKIKSSLAISSEDKIVKEDNVNENSGINNTTLTPVIDYANMNKKNKKSPNSPFRRVKEENIDIKDSRMKDNSFEAKAGARGSWGEKANNVLKKTQGKSFKHEKTKKKRGSYMGGSIDTNVYSIKFD